jgi:geranylgeranyl pyrophosphate synthase
VRCATEPQPDGLVAELAPWRAAVDDALARYLDELEDTDGARPPARLIEATRHALLAGGKRLRPLVCLAVAHATAAADDRGRAHALALPAATALELVHTYSLVHDDLPALDDDDLRRGRPTVHVAYDEGTAVLAGDALLTDAFAVLALAERLAAAQVRELAIAAGAAGMVGGQHDDLQAEGRAASSTSHDELRAIHKKKTGRLFAAAAALGALSVGRSDVVSAARDYGAALGFAFQVQDDVLDVEGDVAAGGKARGRDVRHDKLTTVRLLGIDGAKALAARAGDEAVAQARALLRAVGADEGESAERLIALARFAATRSH